MIKKPKEKNQNHENLDQLIKILLKEELKNCQKQNIYPTIDYLVLQITSKNNIVNSGILGLNFQKKEMLLSKTIENSILRICEEGDNFFDQIRRQLVIKHFFSVDYSVLVKNNEFSIFNDLVGLSCLNQNVPLIEYEKISYLEIKRIQQLGIKTIFICTNFTPYGMKERKVIHGRLKEHGIDSVSLFINKSQCQDLYSIPLSLKQKLRYKEFKQEYGIDTFYLDQLSPDFIDSEVKKIKTLC